MRPASERLEVGKGSREAIQERAWYVARLDQVLERPLSRMFRLSSVFLELCMARERSTKRDLPRRSAGTCLQGYSLSEAAARSSMSRRVIAAMDHSADFVCRASTGDPAGNALRKGYRQRPREMVSRWCVTSLTPSCMWTNISARDVPSATASYRLMPSISFTKPIPSELCDKFAGCFAPGVIEVTQDASSGSKSVVVKEPRRDTVSREVLRHSEFEDSVVLSRKRDHFICESYSLRPPPGALRTVARSRVGKSGAWLTCHVLALRSQYRIGRSIPVRRPCPSRAGHIVGKSSHPAFSLVSIDRSLGIL